MCLFSKSKLVRADKDIVCYKRLFPIFEKDGIKFLTPYQLVEVPIDVLNGEKDFKAIGDKEVSNCDFFGEYSVGSGFIHTYASFGEAVEQAELDAEVCCEDCDEIIVECIIPKGTYYLQGRDSYGSISYASRKIRFNLDSTNAEINRLIEKKNQKIWMS